MSALIKTIAFIIIVAMLSAIYSCHNYYKATSMAFKNEADKIKQVDSLQETGRYFILRNGGEAYYMKNPVLSADQKTLSCTLDSLSFYHRLHLTKGRNGNMKYKKDIPQDLHVLNEVHFYIQPDTNAVEGKYILDLNRVQKIEVLEKDRKRTTDSYVVGAIGYTLGAMAVASVIILAVKSSCPFVSAYTNDEFVLQGEIYGGAIYPQMARHDYIPFKMSPLADGTLQLKISNELKERQFTDVADLMVITHDKHSNVYADENGNLYTISNPITPISATLGKRDILSAISNAGDNEVLHLDDSTQADAGNTVLLHFNKPMNTTRGKLLLTLKNSYWLDMLYGELAKGFGSYYSTYIHNQRKKPLQELLQWTLDQQIPLQVSVKTKSGWHLQTNLTTIGPLANRSVVVPLELPEQDEAVAVKLSSGFMFWEIDYAAIDFSDEKGITVEKLSPAQATDETGKNVLSSLQKEDGIYLEQPDIGNAATLIYTPKQPVNDASKTQTYILHAKGYYEHIRDFKNSPNVAFLKQFTKPNAFPLYGIQLYKKIRNESMQSLAHNN